MVFLTTLFAAASLAVAAVKAQDDVILWHNRYHAVLAMAAYGDYNYNCPREEFTEAKKLQNFPDSSLPAWQVLDEWPASPHQGGGFTVLIPEMDKVVLVFRGDYWKLKHLPTETASLDVLGLAEECPGCRANAFALQGYLEAKELTNGFKKGMQMWRDTGLWWSQTGHGLGGMLSLIAAMDLGGTRNVSKFIHAYGNPRTLNPAAASYYNHIYGGDMTEQGYANGDPTANQIPASGDYAHVNTAFYYYGWDDTYKMNHRVCYEGPDDPSCKPSAPFNELDSWYIFTNVGHCGRTHRQNQDVAAQYLAGLGVNVDDSAITVDPSATSSSNSSTSTAVATANATVTHDLLATVAGNSTLVGLISAAHTTSTHPLANHTVTITSANSLIATSSSTVPLTRLSSSNVATSSIAAARSSAGVQAANAAFESSGLSAATGTSGASASVVLSFGAVLAGVMALAAIY